MRPRAISVLIATLGLGVAALPADAHHSFPAQYDIDKPITLTGKVTKVEWTNPHIFIYADVTDDKGNVVAWTFEMGGPNALIRQGWKRDSLMGQAMEIGSLEAAGLSWRDEDALLAGLRAVTAAEVQAVATRYFDDDSLSVARLDPQPLDESRPPALPLPH